MRAFSLSARVFAGATGLGASFVAGGLAKEKYDQFKVQSIKPLVNSVKDNVNVNMKSMSLNAEEGRERTFIMIKPDGVQRGLMGEIIKRSEQKGFKLLQCPSQTQQMSMMSRMTHTKRLSMPMMNCRSYYGI